MAQVLLQNDHGQSWTDHYFNWDDDEQRARLIDRELPAGGGLLVLDELHKFSRWRNFIKGLYDTQKDRRQFLVTGSGRLDLYRRGGDSLQGRYHHLRLYPISLGEFSGSLDDLLTYGPFPEPLTEGSEEFVRRWSREHRVRVIREDLLSLERVSDVGAIEQLVARLPHLVGSPLSINGLREDLQVSHKAVANWLLMLERLFVIFRVAPFGAPKIKAVKKEHKHYHFDWTPIQDPGSRFENMIGFHLLKHAHFIEDTQGYDCELRFFRDIEGREVDFVLVRDGKALLAVECKLSERRAAPALRFLKRKFPNIEAVQVLHTAGVDSRDADAIRVCSAEVFLKELAI